MKLDAMLFTFFNFLLIHFHLLFEFTFHAVEISFGVIQLILDFLGHISSKLIKIQANEI